MTEQHITSDLDRLAAQCREARAGMAALREQVEGLIARTRALREHLAAEQADGRRFPAGAARPLAVAAAPPSQ